MGNVTERSTTASSSTKYSWTDPVSKRFQDASMFTSETVTVSFDGESELDIDAEMEKRYQELKDTVETRVIEWRREQEED